MSRDLVPVGDEFLRTAGLVLSATIELPHSAEQVWAALESDQMGAWMWILDRTRWHSPRPFAHGARRSVRLARSIRLDEVFYRWDPPRRATFRVAAINLPLVTGWVEDFSVDPLPDGGTLLGWTMAIDNKLLRRVQIPHRARPAATAACRKMMQGIVTIMPPPETPDSR